MWDARKPSVQLVADLLTADTLPGRPYLFIAPTDVVAAVIAEELEERAPHNFDRVLVTSLPELSLRVVPRPPSQGARGGARADHRDARGRAEHQRHRPQGHAARDVPRAGAEDPPVLERAASDTLARL